MASAIGIGLLGARFCGSTPTTSFRVYGLSIGSISMLGVAVLYYRQFAWSDSLTDHFFWLMSASQAMIVTHVILTMVVWKRVYGKPN